MTRRYLLLILGLFGCSGDLDLGADDARQPTSPPPRSSELPTDKSTPASSASNNEQWIIPALLPATGRAEWSQSRGVVHAWSTAEGWMPVTLPNGAKITSVVLVGSHQDATGGSFVVFLMRREPGGTTETRVAVMNASDRAGEFEVSGLLIEPLEAVDNHRYAYVLYARFVHGDPAPDEATIYGVRVNYTLD